MLESSGIEIVPSKLHHEKMVISKEESLLKQIWSAWLKFGHWIGEIMSWVWMPLFYYLIAMPFALGVKFFSDPLKVRGEKQKSYWTPKALPELNLAWAKSQGSIVLPSKESES